jgi:hypothetical protein
MAPKLIMATHALEMIGFATFLNKMLRRAHYTLQPEYEVYARGYGVGLVDYLATLHLEARMVVGAEKYNFHAWGTSVEMDIQEVARGAVTRLHHEHWELWEDPFTYLLVRDPRTPLRMLSRLQLDPSLWRGAWRQPSPPMRWRTRAYFGSWMRQGAISSTSNTKWSRT